MAQLQRYLHRLEDGREIHAIGVTRGTGRCRDTVVDLGQQCRRIHTA